MTDIFWDELRLLFKGIYSEFWKPLLLINYNYSFSFYVVCVCVCVYFFNGISLYFNISFRTLTDSRDILLSLIVKSL